MSDSIVPTQPQTASQNLLLAKSAMNYTTAKLDFGSSNKFFDNLRTLGITALAVSETYKQTEQYLKAGGVAGRFQRCEPRRSPA